MSTPSITTANRDFDVQQLTDTVQGVFADKNALMGSILATQGAVVIKDSLPAGREQLGNTITIPYFGSLGDFADYNDGDAATLNKLDLTNETSTVGRSSLPFEITNWARHSGPADADPYVEAARQIELAAQRKMDSLCVTAAATTPLVLDRYSSTAPVYLDWDFIVDGRALWLDSQEDIIGMVIHSRVEADLRKLKTSQGLPMLTDNFSPQLGKLTTFCGIPLVVSDRVPLTGSTMGAVTSAGTPTPSVITVSGTPLGAWNLKLLCVLGGARGTFTFKFSTDGGNTYSAVLTSAASVPLIDTAKDSLVGKNGLTGLTVAIANTASTAADNWVSTASVKATSLILQKNAIAFWYNRAAMALQTIINPLQDSTVAAMHMYRTAHLYRRRVGGFRPGVVALAHNVRGY